MTIGRADFLREQGIDTTPLEDKAATLRQEASTVIFVAMNDTLAGLIAIADPLKSSAIPALTNLSQHEIHLAMLTGDHRLTAEAIARRLNITDIHAEVLPDQKAQTITELQQENRAVAMVGDGINDAPALASATVGIAMGTGTDVAVESASVVLLSGDLQGVVRALHLSKAARRNIQQNLFNNPLL
ncbi:MAG: HAD-IC family P-type ATPase [Alphaproteobacteria bacterium]